MLTVVALEEVPSTNETEGFEADNVEVLSEL
jgi:hypothetical protein